MGKPKGIRHSPDPMRAVTARPDPPEASLDNLDTLFPAPKPVLIRPMTLHRHGQSRRQTAYTLKGLFPKEVVDVAGWKIGDVLLVEVWANGVVKLSPLSEM